MTRVIQELPAGPLDIIGDVHGEIDALLRLLERLGSDPVRFTAERPLVFVGDLIDRGPDSPAVMELVMNLVAAGVAHCVLGNHELNALLADKKEGNGWWFGDPGDYHQVRRGDHTEKVLFPSVLASPAQRARYDAFLRELPLALVRPDLRVVHACWDSPVMDTLGSAADDGGADDGGADDGGAGDATELARRSEATIDAGLSAKGLLAQEQTERDAFADLRDVGVKPDRPLRAHPIVALARQNDNPVKVATSGLEELIPPEEAFFIGGKWRYVKRSRWWERYDEAPAVVVGHYWRRRDAPPHRDGAPDGWNTTQDTDWTGPRGNVFCVDYSVGRRFVGRAHGDNSAEASHHIQAGSLAALRWPERVLVFDDEDGSRATTRWGGDK